MRRRRREAQTRAAPEAQKRARDRGPVPEAPPPWPAPQPTRNARPRTRPARAPRGAHPPRGERAAGGEEAHRCRGLRTRWAASCGSSRTSWRPGGAGRRRPVASSRRSRLRRAGGQGAGERSALPPLPCDAAGCRPRTAGRAGAPNPAAARTPPGPAQPEPSHCGASAGGAAGLIQPIGCCPPGHAP